MFNDLLPWLPRDVAWPIRKDWRGRFIMRLSWRPYRARWLRCGR